MGGIISEFKRLATKGGQNMAFVKLEDLYGQIEVIAFPKVYEKARDVLYIEEVVKVSGRLQLKDGAPQIVAETIEKLEIKEDQVKEVPLEQEFMGVIIADDKKDILNDVLDILESYEGNIPVIIAMDGKKYNSHLSVRKCEGLLSELKNYVAQTDIIFFKRKSQ